MVQWLSAACEVRSSSALTMVLPGEMIIMRSCTPSPYAGLAARFDERFKPKHATTL